MVLLDFRFHSGTSMRAPRSQGSFGISAYFPSLLSMLSLRIASASRDLTCDSDFCCPAVMPESAGSSFYGNVAA